MERQCKLVDRPEFKKLVTPSEARSQPIHNWFVYPHSYSPSLVKILIHEYGIPKNGRIFDPFVGAGTTILAAKECGVSAIGMDVLPVSRALVEAKVTDYNVTALRSTYARIQGALKLISSDDSHVQSEKARIQKDPKNIVLRAFSEESLIEIIRIKRAIDLKAGNSAEYHFCLVVLLALLEPFSYTMKSGGWLKMLPEASNSGSIVDAFLQRFRAMVKDVTLQKALSETGAWEVIIGDARRFDQRVGKVDAIVTSPPYLNRHDYTRVLCLELLIGFLSENEEIKALRHSLVRSHIESRAEMPPVGYKIPQQLRGILEKLEAADVDYRVPKMVSGYFEDMYKVLQNCVRYLKTGGWAAFVIGNVRFAGISISVDELVAEIGNMVGLTWDKTLVARQRNNSAQQMRDYGREPARESVIVFRK